MNSATTTTTTTTTNNLPLPTSLPTPYQQFIFYRTYSNWLPQKQRRESWDECVDRFINYFRHRLDTVYPSQPPSSPLYTPKPPQHPSSPLFPLLSLLRTAILNLDIVPSMRLLQFSGPAAEKCNSFIYNCSFIIPQCPQDIGEIMYVSMCGVGVGFSVEKKYLSAFPGIPLIEEVPKSPPYVIEDSREGWANSVVHLLTSLFEGYDVEFDYSRIRPAGTPLISTSGWASGPEVLKEAHDFIRKIMRSRQGHSLRSIDLYDIICSIGYCVQCGGMRRSAMISISDLDDEDMRLAKKGAFWESHPYRTVCNNSAVYNSMPTWEEFTEEFNALVDNRTGERGIFNRFSLLQTLPRRRLDLLGPDKVLCMGNNPCGEVILQSKQFCNLTEVICRPWDTEATLLQKVRLAAILGTYQATFTHFKYLSEPWTKHQEEEALLGVSLTGQWDCKAVRNPETLEKLREMAIATNKEFAPYFGIRPSTCVTSIKPSGTTSQLANCSSGLHPQFAPFYIRRVRVSRKDPLAMFLCQEGVPHHDEGSNYVFEFPMRAPTGSITRKDLSTKEHLEYWLMVKKHYTEHNPSCTINVHDEEWEMVKKWIYEHIEYVTGITFLPYDGGVYHLAPYEEITEEEYEKRSQEMPKLDFKRMEGMETRDNTNFGIELACGGNACELR